MASFRSVGSVKSIVSSASGSAAGALALALALGLGGCRAQRAADPGSDAEEWRALQHELEHAPLWASSLHWRPIYDEMLRVGITPREAHRHLGRAARYGPARQDIEKLLDEHRERETLLAALELAHSEQRDIVQEERRIARAAYAHAPGVTSEAEHEWTELEAELERPPLFDSALQWRPVYLDMVRLGLTPKDARSLTRRSAKWGPGRVRVSALLDAHKTDLKAFLAALELEHAESRDLLRSNRTRNVYGFFAGKAIGVKEAPRVGNITGPSEPASPTEPTPEAGADGLGEGAPSEGAPGEGALDDGGFDAGEPQDPSLPPYDEGTEGPDAGAGELPPLPE